jgi:hypothetical protein
VRWDQHSFHNQLQRSAPAMGVDAVKLSNRKPPSQPSSLCHRALLDAYQPPRPQEGPAPEPNVQLQQTTQSNLQGPVSSPQKCLTMPSFTRINRPGRSKAITRTRRRQLQQTQHSKAAPCPPPGFSHCALVDAYQPPRPQLGLAQETVNSYNKPSTSTHPLPPQHSLPKIVSPRPP